MDQTLSTKDSMILENMLSAIVETSNSVINQAEAQQSTATFHFATIVLSVTDGDDDDSSYVAHGIASSLPSRDLTYQVLQMACDTKDSAGEIMYPIETGFDG